MGKSYGIQVCKKALEYLSSDEDFDKRLLRAIGEMKEMKFEKSDSGDLSKKQLDVLEELETEFNELMNKNDNKAKLKFARRLVSLSVEIIKSNA